MLSVAYAAGAPWNETHWKNEKFEKLLADARGETDEAKRKPYIWEMQTMLHRGGRRDHPSLPRLARRPQRQGRRPPPHGGFDMDNGSILERPG